MEHKQQDEAKETLDHMARLMEQMMADPDKLQRNPNLFHLHDDAKYLFSSHLFQNELSARCCERERDRRHIVDRGILIAFSEYIAMHGVAVPKPAEETKEDEKKEETNEKVVKKVGELNVLRALALYFAIDANRDFSQSPPVFTQDTLDYLLMKRVLESH